MIADKLGEYLEWDSNFFDKRIGRVTSERLSQLEMHQVMAWAYQETIDCLYYSIAPDDADAICIAEKNGFNFVDIRLTLDRKITAEPVVLPISGDYIIRSCEDSDVPALRAIARGIYADSRFFHDRNFPRDLCKELYAIWIEKSCHGYADKVIVASKDGEPMGYITCHLATETAPAKIGLFGIAENAQGQGIGSQLLGQSLHWFWEQQISYVTVVTQGRNIAAQRLYQKQGFLTNSVLLWYHRWF